VRNSDCNALTVGIIAIRVIVTIAVAVYAIVENILPAPEQRHALYVAGGAKK
jgi:hypothetical protein